MMLMPNLRQGLRLRLDVFHEESTWKGMRELGMKFELALRL